MAFDLFAYIIIQKIYVPCSLGVNLDSALEHAEDMAHVEGSGEQQFPSASPVQLDGHHSLPSLQQHRALLAHRRRMGCQGQCPALFGTSSAHAVNGFFVL